MKSKCPGMKLAMFPSELLLHLNASDEILSLTRDVGKTSLSPWTYRIDMDTTRFPAMIQEAQCLHKTCEHPSGRLLSKPIQHEILVLHRGTETCSVTVKTKLITVGCTCIRHR
ncbi:interleukin-17F-like [Hyperolius riggenbachi]|uniref:interleukin-17F-like n=1 Tax=Hyperolius riggenbachi TaxID=752182 RepID=UPI0035A28D4B